MWNEEKRSRFAELRRREDDDALSEAERGELARLTDELYALESSYLGPATERCSGSARSRRPKTAG